MGIYEKGVITIVCLNLVSVLISIPLVLRKVPRNIVYGYRTRATLRDDRTWYEANAYFGRCFLTANIITAFAVLVLYIMHNLAPSSFLTASIIAITGPSLICIIATSRFIRSLTSADSADPTGKGN